MLALFALMAASLDGPPASQSLAENRRAIALWQDDRMRAIYTPYFDCYWSQVKDRPDAILRNPNAAQAMFSAAADGCTGPRRQSDAGADAYLAQLPDYADAATRADVIPRYRRQLGIMTLLQHYHDAGKGDLINHYMAELGTRPRNH